MVTINDGDVITTAEQLDAAPIGTTFIDKTDDLLVKIDGTGFAMPADMGNGERWAYFDRGEIIGAYHSPGSVNEPDEHHVPYSTFLPMTVHRTPMGLPKTDDGDIITSAEFGQSLLVRVTYNRDPEGVWVEDDDYSNFTLHGPVTDDEAQAWIDAYPDGDRDLKDIDTIPVNNVRPA